VLLRRWTPTVLSAVLAWSLGCEPAPERRLQGAVVILLDTVRPDRLSAYGHDRPTSPHLEELARGGVLFEQAVSTSSWTLPAVVSLLAGRYAEAGVYGGGKLLSSRVEQLQDAGFATAAVTEGGYVSAHFGFDRGFDSFEEQEGEIRLFTQEGAGGKGGGGIEQTFARAIAWLEEHRNEPFFLMVHTYEAHTPYRRLHFTEGGHRGKLDETFSVTDVDRILEGELRLGQRERDYIGRLYDGGLLEADKHVGLLLASLDALELSERTLVVVTSDHGEDLGGRHTRFAGEHGHTLYDELVRVPLILYDPAEPRPDRRISTQVRIIDVLPTVLELLEVDAPEVGDGRSLVPVMDGSERVDRPALLKLWERSGGKPPSRFGIRSGSHKLVVNRKHARPAAPMLELFDLRVDPGEGQDVAAEFPEQTRELRTQLGAWTRKLAGVEPPEGVELPAELRRRLQELGYLTE